MPQQMQTFLIAFSVTSDGELEKRSVTPVRNRDPQHDAGTLPDQVVAFIYGDGRSADDVLYNDSCHYFIGGPDVKAFTMDEIRREGIRLPANRLNSKFYNGVIRDRRGNWQFFNFASSRSGDRDEIIQP